MTASCSIPSPTDRAAWLAIAALAALSCASAPPPTVEPPVASATAAPVAPAPATAAPTASAAAPPTPPNAACEPLEQVEVPAISRPLFEKGRRLRYSMKDDVDPHGPDGGHITTTTTVSCVVAALCRFPGGAAMSKLACTTDPPTPSDLVPAELGFLADAGSLWMVSALPADESAARKALAETPLLPPTPTSSRRTFDQPGMFEGTRDKCTDALDVTSALVCRDVRCAVKQGYGPTQERTCLSPTRGLASWRKVNLAGPRTTTWELRDANPPR